MENNCFKNIAGMVSMIGLIGCGGASPGLLPNQGTPAPAPGMMTQAEQLGMIPPNSIVVNNSINGIWERANTACNNGTNTSLSGVDLSFVINGNSGMAILKYLPALGTYTNSAVILSIPLALNYLGPESTSGIMTVSPMMNQISCKSLYTGMSCGPITPPVLPTELNYGMNNGLLTLSLDTDVMCSKNGATTTLSTVASQVSQVTGFGSTADFTRVTTPGA
jgi:hypothetical protein